MVTQKEAFDIATSVLVALIPTILSYQAVIMGMIPQDNALAIAVAGLFFGGLSEYAARKHRKELVANAQAEISQPEDSMA